MNEEQSVQDAREWIDAMQKVVRECDDDLLAAFIAGQNYASTDDAPDFQAWLQRRNENRSAAAERERADHAEEVAKSLARELADLRAALARWEATLRGGESQ